MRACVLACLRACMRACVHAFVTAMGKILIVHFWRRLCHCHEQRISVGATERAYIPWQDLEQELLRLLLFLKQKLRALSNERLEVVGVLLHAVEQIVENVRVAATGLEQRTHNIISQYEDQPPSKCAFSSIYRNQ